MRTHAGSMGLVVVLVLLSMGGIGCSRLFTSQYIHGLYFGSTPNGTKLSLKRRGEETLFRPQHSELILGYYRDRGDCSTHAIARLEGAAAHPLVAFAFGKLEARADADERRFWVIDLDKRRIVASFDRNTGAVTGPDDISPPWAKLDGGVLLKATMLDSEKS